MNEIYNKGHYEREPLGDIILDAYVRDVKEDLRRFPEEFTPEIWDRFTQRIIALRPNDDGDPSGVRCKVKPDPNQPQDQCSAAAVVPGN